MHRALVAAAILGYAWLMPSAVSAEEPAGKTVEFTILHLNDVYEIERSGKQPLGGLSRVARLRKKLVEVNPRTYTVLSGDALSPSPLGSAIIEGDELAGRQMVAVLNVSIRERSAYTTSTACCRIREK
jgi:5'-nucleotidase/UDP-sugar diphosphatase